jgi:hypothetical protein
MKETNDFNEASNCYLTSLKLLKTTPLFPFQILTQFNNFE